MNEIPVHSDNASVLPPGKLIDKRFKIIEFISSGATGQVYKCINILTDEELALKILHPALMQDEQTAQRFFREAKLSSQLNHECIAAIKAFGKAEDGSLYMVQELAKGQTLAAIIEKSGSLSPGATKAIAIHLADALAYAHSLKILHRDLKPANVMILNEGDENISAKVLDFGLATLIEPTAEQQKLTKTGVMTGTPAYMSPEQCRGEKATIASDVYSLACIIYEMLLGAPPFQGETALQTMSMHLNQTLKFPADRTIDIKLKDIIQRGLEKDPSKRFADCHSLAAELALVDFQTKRQRPELMAALISLMIALIVIGSIFLSQFMKRTTAAGPIQTGGQRLMQPKPPANLKRLSQNRMHEVLFMRGVDAITRRQVAEQQIADGMKRLPKDPHLPLAENDALLASRIMGSYICLCATAPPSEAIFEKHKQDALNFAKKYLEQKDKDLSQFYSSISSHYPPEQGKKLLDKAFEASTDVEKPGHALEIADLMIHRYKDLSAAKKYLNFAKKGILPFEDNLQFRCACLDYEIANKTRSKDCAQKKAKLIELLNKPSDRFRDLLERLSSARAISENAEYEEALEWSNRSLDCLHELEKIHREDAVKTQEIELYKTRALVFLKGEKWQEMLEIDKDLQKHPLPNLDRAIIVVRDASVLRKMNKIEESIAQYQLACQLLERESPRDYAEALYNTSVICNSAGQKQKARLYAKRLLELIAQQSPSSIDRYRSTAEAILTQKN